MRTGDPSKRKKERKKERKKNIAFVIYTSVLSECTVYTHIVQVCTQ